MAKQPKRHPGGWLFVPTAPVEWRGSIVCDDDCDNCPLFKNGCAGNCTRWDDAVCFNCPCLASRFAAEKNEPTTVEPGAWPERNSGEQHREASHPAEPRLLDLRKRRIAKHEDEAGV